MQWYTVVAPRAALMQNARSAASPRAVSHPVGTRPAERLMMRTRLPTASSRSASGNRPARAEQNVQFGLHQYRHLVSWRMLRNIDTRCSSRGVEHFSGLMAVHPTEDVVEDLDGLRDVGSFIQHDALGAVRVAVVTSARDGIPSLASVSSTCVAPITGTCPASHTQRILLLHFGHPLNPHSTARSPRAIIWPARRGDIASAASPRLRTRFVSILSTMAGCRSPRWSEKIVGARERRRPIRKQRPIVGMTCGKAQVFFVFVY